MFCGCSLDLNNLAKFLWTKDFTKKKAHQVKNTVCCIYVQKLGAYLIIISCIGWHSNWQHLLPWPVTADESSPRPLSEHGHYRDCCCSAEKVWKRMTTTFAVVCFRFVLVFTLLFFPPHEHDNVEEHLLHGWSMNSSLILAWFYISSKVCVSGTNIPLKNAGFNI